MPYYVSGGGGSFGGGGGESVAPRSASRASVQTIGGAEPADTSGNSMGKTTVDLTNPVNSIFDAAGSIAGLGGSLFGGIIGTAGSVGVPGGPNLGGVAKAIGAPIDIAATQIGKIPLESDVALDAQGKPIIENGKFKSRSVSLGEAVPRAMTALGAPAKAVEYQFARNVRANNRDELPPDLQLALDQGASLDDIANELVRRGQGYSSNPGVNLAGELVLDPVNLAGPALGRLGTIAKGASVTVRGAEDVAKLGLSTRLAAATYDVATAGMNRGSAAVMDRLIGSSTSGMARAIGTGEITGIGSRLAQISPEAGAAWDTALGVANAQHMRAVIGNVISDEGTSGTLVMAGSKAAEADIINARLLTELRLAPKTIEDGVYRIVSERSQLWLNKTPEEMAAQAATDLAAATGIEQDAARLVIGTTATRETALAAREAVFGRAVNDLMSAKAVSGASDVIDVGRLTLIAGDTLTTDRATEVIKAVADGGMTAAKAAIEQYPEMAAVFYGRKVAEEVGAGMVGKTLTKEGLAELRDAAAGKAAGHFTTSDVVKWLKDNMDRLPSQVKEATTGANPLPEALSAFRDKFRGLYDLGFEPEQGWKLRETVDGVFVPVRPFVAYASDKAPLALRNPLGRAADAMMGGIRQARIINEAQQRLLKFVVPQGISQEEARAVFRAVLNKARDMDTTPRGLADHISKVFTDVLGEARVASLPFNPTYAVNLAFEGNLGTVGITQKMTGIAKTMLSNRGNFGVRIAENLYPDLKFKMNPVFWAQEIVESPFWNVMRGVNPWGKIDPQLKRLYDEVVKQPIARQIFEAGYTTQIGGAISARNLTGKLERLFPDLSKGLPAFKERQAFLQAAHDLPDTFKNAINEINPKLWTEMETAYATKDAGEIAKRFLTERLNLATDQRTLGWELDKLAAKGALATPETETMWQAFRYSLQKASDQAYKTHFFNPERGWLERTINHPYLGLYPASYMWGKVLPEFARFLLYKPFGVKAPLVGYEAASHVQQAIVQQMNDPAFADAVKQNDGLIYVLQLMLPATPSDIVVNSPAWARHAATGKIPTMGKFTPEKEATDILQNIGVTRAPKLIGDLRTSLSNDIGSLQQQLTDAAKAYDGTVPVYGLPPANG